MSDELDFENELQTQVLREEATRWCRMAYQAQVDGRIEEAIRLYTESIEIYPTAEAYTLRAKAKSQLRQLDAALEDCHQAIKVDPEFGNPYNDIGDYLIQKGDYYGAIPWLEKALQAQRYDYSFYAHYNLGRIYEKHGEWIRALQCYKAAYDENSNYEQALKAYRRLLAQLS